MKPYRLPLVTLLVTLAFAAGANAPGSEYNIASNEPRFSDPGSHNPSRIVARPGGSAYYGTQEPRIINVYNPADRTTDTPAQ